MYLIGGWKTIRFQGSMPLICDYIEIEEVFVNGS